MPPLLRCAEDNGTTPLNVAVGLVVVGRGGAVEPTRCAVVVVGDEPLVVADDDAVEPTTVGGVRGIPLTATGAMRGLGRTTIEFDDDEDPAVTAAVVVADDDDDGAAAATTTVSRPSTSFRIKRSSRICTIWPCSSSSSSSSCAGTARVRSLLSCEGAT